MSGDFEREQAFVLEEAAVALEGFGNRLADCQKHVNDLQGEVERLQQPLEGDLESQAMAWRAVCEALKKIGMDEFSGVNRTGRECAIEFIEHLGKNQKEPGTGAEILVWPS